jgi:hypothetical protein
VKVVDVLRDDFAFEILPWAASNPVACVDRLRVTFCLAAEIGMPGLVSRPDRRACRVQYW